MLVLSRRLQEAIVIAGRIKVTVLAISPTRVDLGVEAPSDIAIDREEIHLRKKVSGEARAKAARPRRRPPRA